MEIDSKRLKTVEANIAKNTEVLEALALKIIEPYCEELDTLITNIKDIVFDTTQPPTEVELEEAVLQLSALLYFVGSGQEQLGLQEDLAKALRQETYNTAIRTSTGKTVGEKAAIAEQQAAYETVAWNLHSRAAKMIKQKVEAGYELLVSCKKIVSKRIAEYEAGNMENLPRSKKRGSGNE